MTPWTTSCVGHRDEEHRFGLGSVADDDAPRVGGGVADPQDLAVAAATHPVRPSPIGIRRLAGSGRSVPRKVPWNAIGSQTPVLVIDAIDADRVVVDDAAGLVDDGPGDAVGVLLVRLRRTGQLRDRRAGARRATRVDCGEARCCASRSRSGRRTPGPGPSRRSTRRSPAVVEDQQAEDLVANDDRDVAHRPDALGAVHPRSAGTVPARSPSRTVTRSFAHGASCRTWPRRAGSEPRRRASPSDRPRWAARRSGVGRIVVGPQAGPIHPEQGEGLVDDLLEQTVEVELRRRPPPRSDAGRRRGSRWSSRRERGRGRWSCRAWTMRCGRRVPAPRRARNGVGPDCGDAPT